jgi:hypothetical protein
MSRDLPRKINIVGHQSDFYAAIDQARCAIELLRRLSRSNQYVSKAVIGEILGFSKRRHGDSASLTRCCHPRNLG